MYHILLVDDDPIMVSALKHLIDWEKNNCLITGTASNGHEAIKKIRQLQPDIVICDIAMPDISGLDLLKQTEKEFPNAVFIMLTNHEDFQFVRKSLQHRAAEYLVKNDLEPQVLENALARAASERENRKKLHRVSEADELFQAQKQQERIRNTLNNFLTGDSPLQPEDRALLAKEKMLCNFAFAFIPVNYSILPDYPDICTEERKKIFAWEREIAERLALSFFPHSLLLPCSPPDEYADNKTFALDLLLFAWKLKPELWKSNIAHFRERLVKTSSQITRLGVDVIASDFFALNESPSLAFGRIREIYYRTCRGVHSEAIQKALQYILNNVEKRIMLNDVASYACISPGYLSTLFKREYNQSLVDFINQTKIDFACELLKEKKYRVNEISNMLGYENAFYFTRVFRRHTGFTPSEYRENFGDVRKPRTEGSKFPTRTVDKNDTENR